MMGPPYTPLSAGSSTARTPAISSRFAMRPSLPAKTPISWERTNLNRARGHDDMTGSVLLRTQATKAFDASTRNPLIPDWGNGVNTTARNYIIIANPFPAAFPPRPKRRGPGAFACNDARDTPWHRRGPPLVIHPMPTIPRSPLGEHT